ncbi:MFS transporter [Sulfitobacter aestuariivivens]|uniref:MFS transporter n=1 Tax=Sulfitobacter aestuariivivens TaxID=2766981 RepID=UPI00360F3935
MTSRQFIVLLVCVAIFALGQFHRASGSVFTPILMDSFGISAATVAGLVSAMFFATIAVQVPFGSALDRIGPRKVLAVCMGLVAGARPFLLARLLTKQR